MANHTYKIPRVTDAQISHALTKLGEELEPFSVSFNVIRQALGSPVTFPDSSEFPVWRQVIDLNGELIDHFSANLCGVTLTYYRGGSTGDPVQKSPVLDDLVIDLNGMDGRRLKVAAKVLEIFRPIASAISAGVTEPQLALQAIQQSTFTRLEKQLEELFAQTIQVRQQLDDAVRQKTEALEAAFKSKEQDAQEEISRQKARLLEKEEQLQRRVQELDDSDNTFARRKIRDGMLSDVTERVRNFDVSSATRTARKPVALGMLCLICLFLPLMVWTGYELFESRQSQQSITAIAASLSGVNSPSSATASTTKPLSAELAASMLRDASTERIALWIRFSLLTIGLVGTMLYYIRWQSRWAEQFAATENSLKQFHLDVSRANWVVETCLEWRKESETAIPTPLIDSLTRGLFTQNDPAPQAIHPADELASALVGSASKISLAVGDNKIEYDKPGKIPKSVPAPKPGN